MHTIYADNINDATAKGIRHLLDHGIEEPSRNGKVLVAPEPVTTVYLNPQQRVLFSPKRNANPFFHLMESLWMLAGRNDIAWPAKFNARFIDYSDDGKSQFGAYGWRWREFFGYDQLQKIIYELKFKSDSRRCVLSMWNAYELDEYEDESVPLLSHCDLFVATHGGKDVPCNTHAYFDCRGGKLNMTVCNRSNDIIWGAYGANAVHFSILQEYMAIKIGVPVGQYRQMSNNFHAYLDVYNRDALEAIADDSENHDEYALHRHALSYVPLMDHPDEPFEKNINYFLDQKLTDGRSKFLTGVAEPMLWAWEHRNANTKLSLNYINSMLDCDWKFAAEQWLIRKEARREQA